MPDSNQNDREGLAPWFDPQRQDTGNISDCHVAEYGELAQ
jgi:hypothetical protein